MPGKISENHSSDTIEQRTARELTAFQQNILIVLSKESQYGFAIKRELEAYYDNEVNHGRLYPNLDSLVEQSLIAKSEFDKQANRYELTDEGYDLLVGELDWRLSRIVTDDGRATQIETLVE